MTLTSKLRRLTLLAFLLPAGAQAQPAVPPPPSTDGSVLLQGSTGSLQTTDGKWTFEGTTNAIDLNGSRAAGGAGNKLQVSNGGKIYAVGMDNKWWVWGGTSWTPTGLPGTGAPPALAAPPPSTVAPGQVILVTAPWDRPFVPGTIILRTDRALTISSIVGNVVIPEGGTTAVVDVRKNTCSGVTLNTKAFAANALPIPEQDLGVASASLAAGDRVVLCPSGFPVVAGAAAWIGNSAITVSASVK